VGRRGNKGARVQLLREGKERSRVLLKVIQIENGRWVGELVLLQVAI